MSATLTALLGFIFLHIVLVMSLGVQRTVISLANNRPANTFVPDGQDVGPASVRIVRAHANSYESFVFTGGLLLLALATDQTAITDPLALIMLGARVAQALVHVISTSVPAVMLRFALFLVQLVIALYWLARFAGVLGG